MSRSPNVPLRSCVGCDQVDRQDRMERFTLVGGRPTWDGVRPRAGRGAWLHRNAACAARLVARKPFVRSLRVSLDRAARARLVEERSEVA